MSAKISKEELRRLMKERKATISRKKIDSPLARYDEDGNLICIICNSHLNESQWSSHLQTHKRIEQLKKKKNVSEENHLNQVKTSSIAKRKNEDNLVVQSPKIAKSDSNSSFGSIDPSSEINEITLTNNDIISEPTKRNDEIDDSSNIDKVSTKEVEGKMCEGLPKGFFDDPVKDAKARNTPFKDPLEEEWEHFQKIMAKESNASEAVVEGDLEDIQVERNIEEIENQISGWSRINTLQAKAEELLSSNKLENLTSSMEVETSDEDEDMDIFSDWRCKGTQKQK